MTLYTYLVIHFYILQNYHSIRNWKKISSFSTEIWEALLWRMWGSWTSSQWRRSWWESTLARLPLSEEEREGLQATQQWHSWAEEKSHIPGEYFHTQAYGYPRGLKQGGRRHYDQQPHQKHIVGGSYPKSAGQWPEQWKDMSKTDKRCLQHYKD